MNLSDSKLGGLPQAKSGTHGALRCSVYYWQAFPVEVACAVIACAVWIETSFIMSSWNRSAR